MYIRWCYLTSEFRRYADSVDRLAKSIFGDQRRRPPIDLVAMMAAQSENAEPEVSESKSES